MGSDRLIPSLILATILPMPSNKWGRGRATVMFCFLYEHLRMLKTTVGLVDISVPLYPPVCPLWEDWGILGVKTIKDLLLLDLRSRWMTGTMASLCR